MDAVYCRRPMPGHRPRCPIHRQARADPEVGPMARWSASAISVKTIRRAVITVACRSLSHGPSNAIASPQDEFRTVIHVTTERFEMPRVSTYLNFMGTTEDAPSRSTIGVRYRAHRPDPADG